MKQKMIAFFNVLKIVKNWPVYFFDYFKLIKSEYIQIELRNGLVYKVRAKTPDRGVINEVWMCDCYTPKGFEINNRDIVVDVGAHIGVFSIFAAKYAKKGKIFSIEPFNENYVLLKENIKINKIKNIKTTKKALSEKSGEQTLYTGGEACGNSFYFNKDKVKKIKIKTLSIGDFMKKNKIDKIDFLKMDCEGAEYDILFNCKKGVLKNIKKISMEYHNINNKKNIKSLKSFLIKEGFKVTIIEGVYHIGMLYAKR